MTSHNLPVSTAAAADILEHTFGYSEFRGQQEEIINSAVEGNDLLVLMPTGGGKSLCYQIPALIRSGMGIVISPLIALMQDQVSALQQLGIKASYLNSTLTVEESREVIQQIRSGELDLLYIAPERLLNGNTLSLLTSIPISLIAIDEAHCVSQWGHDFRQDYLSLHQLSEYFSDVPRLALTATADDRTRLEIIQRLDLREPKVYVSSFDRPNIRYTVQAKGDYKKQMVQFLRNHKEEAGIIYCMSRKKVESTAAWLQQRSVNALPYHAGLSNEVRAEHQRRFLHEDAVVIVATIAFGMGIDKPDVRFVLHLDLPKSMEAYYQETGRAGRDGEASNAYMLYGLQDVVRITQMVDGSGANDQQKRIERSNIDALLGWCEITTCRRVSLLQYFGEDSHKPCGNCDICLSPPKTWNATEAAQKLLSNVYRTGQRFGAGHVIDVLRGKLNDKVQQFQHDKLSTFGIGESISEKQWRSVIRQLVIRGYIVANAEQYGALQLTELSRPVLRGESTLFLREDSDLDKPERKKAKRQTYGGQVNNDDKELWEALRQCRKELADEHNVPPFHIFHDATLMEMMEYRPQSLSEMLTLNGIGDVKLDRYGSDFLNVIMEH